MTDLNDEKELPTIGMLLDIEHLYGGHESRMGPIIAVIAIGCVPPLIYVYYAMWTFFPLWLFITLDVIVTIEAALILPGKQRERVAKYKKQLYSDYSEPAKLLNVKTIHPDGCVEFVNGTICYYVCCFNGTTDNDVQRSTLLRKLLANMIGDYEYDTYIVNIDDSPALRDYYKKVSTFNKSDAAVNFVHIIDHNLDLVENSSIVLCTIYAIKGSRSDWKEMANQIDTALGSRLARCYKTIYRVKDEEDVNAILNRDADTVINIGDLLRKKYSTQQYNSSKVLAYDLPDDKVIVQGGSKVKPVIPEQTNHSFHKVWKDET